MEALIESSISGKPLLKGRRLDVRHVIWGITVFDPESIFTYQNQFGISLQQIRHAILYCKDEVCVRDSVNAPCTGCGKHFSTMTISPSDDVQDCSEVAQEAYIKWKKQLRLPENYEALFLAE